MAIQRTDILNNVSMEIGTDGWADRPQRRRQDHAGALDHGPAAFARAASSSTTPIWRRYRRTGAAVTASVSCRRIDALSDLSVAENVLLPAWAAKLNDADERLAWTYERMPEVQQFADRKASL